MKIGFLFFAAATVQWGQISDPQIGVLRDRAGNLRPVSGIAGNFVTGDPRAVGVISSAVYEHRIYVKLAREIKVFDREWREIASYQAPEGPAMFSRTMVYFPAVKALFGYTRRGLAPINVEGDVLGVGDDFILVRRSGIVWKVRPNGELLESLGEMNAPMVALDSGEVLCAGDLLVDNVLEMARMDRDWVHVRTSLASYALRINDRKLYMIPDPAP